MDLTITSEQDASSRTVVTAVGAIDLATRGELLDVGRAALNDAAVTGLVLDLAGVSFIDSTGIGVLVELAGDAVDAERSFAIANPSARVSRILEVTGLLGEWRIEADR